MFRRLLVPLDGSRYAEEALPVAAALADRLGAGVVLAHVLERDAPRAVHGQTHLRTAEEAEAYLRRARLDHFRDPERVEVHVHEVEVRDVVDSLVEHERELGFDLIVMCTHGRGGLNRAVYGSVAQQILARGLVPVLVIRPGRMAPTADFRCRSLLVPWDASAGHAAALGAAVELARACPASLRLLTVIPTFGSVSGRAAVTSRTLPGTTSGLLELSMQAAAEALERERERLAGEGLDVTADITRGDPARTIAATASRFHADLVVLATHGKAGAGAFWAGSVASNVCWTCRVPVLLVPADEQHGR